MNQEQRTDCVHHFIIQDERVHGREKGTCKKCGLAKVFRPAFPAVEGFGKLSKDRIFDYAKPNP